MKLRKYMKPYLLWMILAPLAMVVEVSMDLAQPTLMSTIVDDGILAMSDGAVTGNLSVILWTSLKMVICALIGVAGGMGCTYFSSKASQNFGADLRSDLFRKVQSFSFAETDKFSTGSLVTRLTNDVTQLQNLLMMALRMFIRTPLLCFGGIFMALSINLKFGLILLVSLPVMLLLIGVIMKIATPFFNKMQTGIDTLNAVFQENLAGVRVVKAFTREKHEKQRFDKANDSLTSIMLKAMRLMSVVSPLMILFMNGTVIAVIFIGGKEVDAASLEVGQVMSVVTYMTQALMSLMMMSMMFMMVSRAQVSAKRVREVLNTESSIDRNETSVLSVTEGTVSFENVSFSYPEAAGDSVLQGINLEIKKGEFVAFLGATGSGKSTLVNLIPRFYDVTAGAVKIDGHDVREYATASLRSEIGMVLQEAVLFSGTIMENIKWGNPDATDEEAVKAAKIAQADDFVSSFADGYETVLGQRGLSLSGGQKQRLSISRAILKKPKIMIMDDSTSALDMGTEARLQKALKENLNDMTLIIIAQRISSVMSADRIVVLDQGKIAAAGTHEELLETSDIYRDIYDSQVGLGGVEDVR